MYADERWDGGVQGEGGGGYESGTVVDQSCAMAHLAIHSIRACFRALY